MQRLGLKIYQSRLLHGLLEDDLDHHLQFCKVVLNDKRQGNGIVDKITWSDEAHFKLSGAVNWHNCVYYSTQHNCVYYSTWHNCVYYSTRHNCVYYSTRHNCVYYSTRHNCVYYSTRHNCVYYSTENPHVTIGQLNQPGVTVWAGL